MLLAPENKNAMRLDKWLNFIEGDITLGSDYLEGDNADLETGR